MVFALQKISLVTKIWFTFRVCYTVCILDTFQWRILEFSHATSWLNYESHVWTCDLVYCLVLPFFRFTGMINLPSNCSTAWFVTVFLHLRQPSRVVLVLRCLPRRGNVGMVRSDSIKLWVGCFCWGIRVIRQPRRSRVKIDAPKPLTHWRFFYVQSAYEAPSGSQLLSGVAGSGTSMPEILKIFGGSQWWRTPTSSNCKDPCRPERWHERWLCHNSLDFNPHAKRYWETIPQAQSSLSIHTMLLYRKWSNARRPWNETGERVALVQQLLERPQGCKGCN